MSEQISKLISFRDGDAHVRGTIEDGEFYGTLEYTEHIPEHGMTRVTLTIERVTDSNNHVARMVQKWEPITYPWRGQTTELRRYHSYQQIRDWHPWVATLL